MAYFTWGVAEPAHPMLNVALAPAVPLDAFQWRDAGKLVVYRTRAAFDAATAKPDSAGTRQVWSAARANRSP